MTMKKGVHRLFPTLKDNHDACIRSMDMDRRVKNLTEPHLSSDLIIQAHSHSFVEFHQLHFAAKNILQEWVKRNLRIERRRGVAVQRQGLFLFFLFVAGKEERSGEREGGVHYWVFFLSYLLQNQRGVWSCESFLIERGQERSQGESWDRQSASTLQKIGLEYLPFTFLSTSARGRLGQLRVRIVPSATGLAASTDSAPMRMRLGNVANITLVTVVVAAAVIVDCKGAGWTAGAGDTLPLGSPGRTWPMLIDTWVDVVEVCVWEVVFGIELVAALENGFDRLLGRKNMDERKMDEDSCYYTLQLCAKAKNYDRYLICRKRVAWQRI